LLITPEKFFDVFVMGRLESRVAGAL